MKKEIQILQEVADYLNENVFSVDLKDEMIISDYATIVILNKKCISISFDVNCEPTEAAIITKLVIEVSRKFRSFHVEIYEPYLTAYDENGKCTGTLWGDDITAYKEKQVAK